MKRKHTLRNLLSMVCVIAMIISMVPVLPAMAEDAPEAPAAEETAAEDACRMEHVISDTSFAAVKRYLGEPPPTET